MTKFLILLLLIPFFGWSQCPIKGDSPTPKLQHIDSLKNRTATSKTAISMNVTQFLPVGNPKVDTPDYTKFSATTYVAMKGYVVGVKWGGSETCNCHSKNQDDMDFHIEIASSPTETDHKKMMVVEVSRFTRGTMTLQTLKTLIGKQVTVYGWLFFDQEHWQNAVMTNPTGTNLWRATCWEIHPVNIIVPIQVVVSH